MIITNNDVIVKCKISNSLSIALKNILDKMNLTQQEFLEKQIKKFILDNIDMVVGKGIKNEK